MSEQVDKLKQALRTTQKISAADFRAMQQKAAISYAKHFPDPLQAATDDVLGQCLEALEDLWEALDYAWAELEEIADESYEFSNCLSRAKSILAMTGGEK